MLLYQGKEFSTMNDCYHEARLLAEALAELGLGFPHEPRRGGKITFNRHANGDLKSIFVQTETETVKG